MSFFSKTVCEKFKSYVPKKSLGQWPTSMKLAFPMYRPSGPLPARGSSNAGGNRRSHVLQRAAGKMFHQWAEVISHRLEEMITEDQQLQTEINAMVNRALERRSLTTKTLVLLGLGPRQAERAANSR